MPVQAWKIYAKAKRALGQGQIQLGASAATQHHFLMALHRSAASANIRKDASISTWGSIGNEISARGGYVAGGRALPPTTGIWTSGVSARQFKFTMSTVGVVFTASNSQLNLIKFAVIRNSTGAAAGRAICYCSLSSQNFNIGINNTLTILPATTGIFTLA